MGFVWNIRGTNGSGKSTLARAFLPPNPGGDERGGPVDLNWYPSPTKKDPGRQLRVEGHGLVFGWDCVGVVGPYNTACGGLDAVPSFPVQQGAISYMLSMAWPDHHGIEHVIAEGVLSSTVYGSWATFDRELEAEGHRFAWCYLDTPLDVCFERIAARQAAAGRVGKVIKRELVADKHRAIAATRAKAVADGRLVYDLPWATAAASLSDIMQGLGEGYRVH